MFSFETNVGYERNWIKGNALGAVSGGNVWRMKGLQPVSDVKGIGYIVYGYDDWSGRISFRTYMDFAKATDR